MPENTAPDDALDQIRVVGGEPSAEHAAAAIAVVAGMLVEGGTVDAENRENDWDKSARAPRTIIDRSRDTWNTATPQ
jgi:hypothetical protein